MFKNQRKRAIRRCAIVCSLAKICLTRKRLKSPTPISIFERENDSEWRGNGGSQWRRRTRKDCETIPIISESIDQIQYFPLEEIFDKNVVLFIVNMANRSRIGNAIPIFKSLNICCRLIWFFPGVFRFWTRSFILCRSVFGLFSFVFLHFDRENRE